MSDLITNRSSTAQTMFSDQGDSPVPGNEDVIELALQEALNNAVGHGNGLGPGKQIRIRCHCEQKERVSLFVADQGQGFDPNAARSPSS